MSENPGVYIAMKSIGPPPSHFQAYPLMQPTPMENDEKTADLVSYVFDVTFAHRKRNSPSPLFFHRFP